MRKTLRTGLAPFLCVYKNSGAEKPRCSFRRASTRTSRRQLRSIFNHNQNGEGATRRTCQVSDLTLLPFSFLMFSVSFPFSCFCETTICVDYVNVSVDACLTLYLFVFLIVCKFSFCVHIIVLGVFLLSKFLHLFVFRT